MSDLPSARLSPRARAILAGLIRTARVQPMVPGDRMFWRGLLRVDRVGGDFFWLAADGSRLLRGRDAAEAEPLAAGFILAMERAGSPRRGLEIPQSSLKSCIAHVSS
jgi:hypothetical protein